MSATPPHPSTHPAQTFDWVNCILLVLFAGAVLGILVWGVLGAPRYWESSDIVVDEQRRTNGGYLIESGRIYDQAQVEIGPATDLVLPMTRGERPIDREVQPNITIAMRSDGKPGVVLVLIEQKISDAGHYGRSILLRDRPREPRLWKRQVGSVLALDVSPGFTSFESANLVRAIFVLPPDQKVRQEPPTSHEFTSRYKADEKGSLWPVSDDAGTIAGWERVPQQPLARWRFR
jgi:hypothetical protein